MSAYQYYTDPSGQSSLAPLTAFIEPTSQASMIGVDATHDLYNRFAAQRNKPFMLGETGAAFVSALGGAALGGASIDQEAAIKKSWWLAIFATTVSDPAKRYPKFKAAIWFEESKAEESYVDRSQVTKDYYITRNPVIANQFVQDAQAVSILWANNLNVTCAGQLVIR